MRSLSKKASLGPSLFFLLSACGTHVPSLQEASTGQRAESLLVGAITQSIKCDISNAVVEFVNATGRFKRTVPIGAFGYDFWNSWGAQVALSLTVEEKSGVNPSIVGLPSSPATALLTVGFSGTASADAKRTSKSNYFVSIKDLYTRGGCATGIQPIEGSPSLLIQDDLQMKSWLLDQLPAIGTGEVRFPSDVTSVYKQNVLQQEVSFDVLTNAALTPAWKFTNVTVNQTGSFLTASRERTSDLIVTFGPLDPKQRYRSLEPEAEQAHFALQNGYATQVGITNALTRASFFPF